MVKCGSTNLDSKGKEQSMDLISREISANAKGRSVAVSPDGNFIVMGCLDGTIRCFDKNLKQ